MKRGRGRDKVRELDENFLKSMPKAKYSYDVWYDTVVPDLCVKRAERKPVFFYAKPNTARNKMRFINLHATSLEGARTKVTAMANGGLPLKEEAPPDDLMVDPPPEDDPQYESLMGILMDAYTQAAQGKGNERHGAGQSFEKQDIIRIMDRFGVGFALGQAAKKMMEGNRLNDWQRARREWLGAIVYIAGAVLWRDKEGK